MWYIFDGMNPNCNCFVPDCNGYIHTYVHTCVGCGHLQNCYMFHAIIGVWVVYMSTYKPNHIKGIVTATWHS